MAKVWGANNTTNIMLEEWPKSWLFKLYTGDEGAILYYIYYIPIISGFINDYKGSLLNNEYYHGTCQVRFWAQKSFWKMWASKSLEMIFVFPILHEKTYSRWFKVTFLSPSSRSHLSIPKRSQRLVRIGDSPTKRVAFMRVICKSHLDKHLRHLLIYWVMVSDMFIFTPICWRFPFWLIFFKRVETTN